MGEACSIHRRHDTCTYNFFFDNLEGTTPLRRRLNQWEDNIRKDLKEAGRKAEY
jgi:hypothetical protein